MLIQTGTCFPPNGIPRDSGNVLKSIHEEDNFDSPQKTTGQHDNWSKHATLESIHFAVEYSDVDGTIYFRLLCLNNYVLRE